MEHQNAGEAVIANVQSAGIHFTVTRKERHMAKQARVRPSWKNPNRRKMDRQVKQYMNRLTKIAGVLIKVSSGRFSCSGNAE